MIEWQAVNMPRGQKIRALRHQHGKSYTKLWRVWTSMRGRCFTPSVGPWRHYGGRSITVCKQWDDFRVFEKWAIKTGYRHGLYIDRINPNGHYKPSNCRWVTPKQSADNRRNTIWITAFGEYKTLQNWVEDPRCKIKRSALQMRIKKLGWLPEMAITVPSLGRGKGSREQRIFILERCKAA